MTIRSVNDRLGKRLGEIEKSDAFIGASASVRCSQNYYWNKVVGSSKKNGKEPIGLNQAFLTYSITKTFIAVAVLKLCQASKLQLDDHAVDIIKDFSGHKQATVRQLLNHTSGLPDYGGLERYHADVKSTPGNAWSRQDFVKTVAEQGLLFEPEKGWQYSNIGYMYLKEIVEITFGAKFAEALEELIIKPIGMFRTSVVSEIADLKKLAPGFSSCLGSKDELVEVRSKYHPGWCAPGLVSSTALDIAKFYGTIFDTNFLPEYLRDQMLKPVEVPDVPPDSFFKKPSYGFGLMIDPENDLGCLLGHLGAGPGYSAAAFLRYKKGEDSLCSVILANSENIPKLEDTAISLLKEVVDGRES